ncbi:hypothetical protein HY624_04315 [Candidatus Uhrbacteria bacterium]|nr:hypothetical protein [Candidatus Uhrbacteria bacterium]
MALPSQNTPGLTENELRVYQALLDLGTARVSTISKRANLNRTTSYDILNRLMLHGLVAPASGVGSRKQYTAEHPVQLTHHLNRQQRTIELLREKIPELALLYKTIKKPSIKFFEGTEGLKQIFLESLTSKTEILAILDVEAWDVPDLTAWGKNYNHMRAQQKLHERILALETPKTVQWLTHYPTTLKYTKYKFIPQGTFPFFNAEVNIYENKVLIALPQKPNRMGILIQSEELATIFRTMFELVWRSLPEIKKQNKK